MDSISESRTTSVMRDFLATSQANRLKTGSNEKAWEDILLGFASGADPIFEEYKRVVGAFHWTPLEIYRLTFPGEKVSAGDLTVICWILPQREQTRSDNRQEQFYSSERWIRARIIGEKFNNALRQHLVAELAARAINAVAPVISPSFARMESDKYVFASTWSERHAAYAAGLGTFGLCDGLITPKGKAHRVGSVVAKATITPTERPYTDPHAYCLYFFDGTCKTCAKRCPVEAISERGHDKVICRRHVRGACADHAKQAYGFEGWGCGLCQTGVPCEAGIPTKIAKALKSADNARIRS